MSSPAACAFSSDIVNRLRSLECVLQWAVLAARMDRIVGSLIFALINFYSRGFMLGRRSL